MKAPRILFNILGLSLALALFSAPGLAEEAAEAAALKSLEWRSIGPANMGGRVSDIVGIPGDPSTFFFAGADGGLWKTTNTGTTFEPLFEDQPVYSVGAVTLAPSDHHIIWLGSGEGDPRNSVSYGNGVYRSMDGGKNWKHLGLDDSERIRRIVVDPQNPDVALVCAMGHEWGPNEERGVFKTVDGGVTWEKVLYIDEDTGCSDIAMDETNPRYLYTGMWTFRRQPWRFDGGGKETALYKSTDGGDTWTKKTKGLPKGPMARIGVSVAQSQPNTVYMITEAKDEGILYRSDDWGESWKVVHKDANINFRPFYYSEIRVDPNNPEVIYSLSGGLFKSTDGGKNFERIGRDVHGDHQALWINPKNSNHVLNGSDGGYQVSYDGGQTWDIINNVVLSQFYQIFFDDRDPYYVCGGLQDNGTWCGPSRTNHAAGILKDDWYLVSWGDGFYGVPIPGEPHLIYSNSQGGPIYFTDTRSGNSRQIHPYPRKSGSAGDAIVDHKYRFNWDAPIHISPHDPKTVYYGGNVLFKSTNYGHSWEEISPDLTTNDTEKQQSSGGAVYVDNTAAEFHCTILTIAESPVEAGVIWVGTDDGNVQVTRDGGQTWTNVKDNMKGLPAFTWVAKFEASTFEGGTAYVAVDNHRLDDFKPYAFKTTDYGATWTALAGGLPQDDYVKVIREDPKNPQLLYIGMDRGLFASWDGGQRWVSIRNNLPPVSVRDIKIHPRENDLIIGTHGRGAWILDDIAPLQKLSDAMQADSYLFDVRPATRWQIRRRGSNLGTRTYAAANPEAGAYINYYLKEAPEKPLKITVTDASGQKVVDITEKEPKAGINRAVWSLRHEGPAPLRSQQGGGGGFMARFAGRMGPPAVPGDYTVSIKVGEQEHSAKVLVKGDPRIEMSQADYQKQYETAKILRDLTSKVNGAIDTTFNINKQLTGLKDQMKFAGEGENTQQITEALDKALAELKELDNRLQRPVRGLQYRQYPRMQDEVRGLMFSMMGSTTPPTEAQLTVLKELEHDSGLLLADVDKFVQTTIQDSNQMLGAFPKIMVMSSPTTE